MKCEICHIADAEKAIMRKTGGQEQELYVCSVCAVEARVAEQGEKIDDLKQKVKKLSKKAGASKKKEPDPLPELVGMIIDATLEIMNHVLPSQESVCPHCGTTRSDYRKASRLGCASCYETFTKELAGLIADMHRTPQHMGKAPKRPVPSKGVQKLMRRLKAADHDRRVDEAAALREAIRAFGWEPDAPKEDT